MERDLGQEMMMALEEELEYLVLLEKNLQTTLNWTDFGPEIEKVFKQRKMIAERLRLTVQRVRKIEAEMKARHFLLPEEAKILLRSIIDKAGKVRRMYATVRKNLQYSIEDMMKDSRKLYQQNKSVLTYFEQV